MISFIAPSIYKKETGILSRAGSYIGAYGKNALIIGGKTALSAAGEPLYKSLEENGFSYEVKELEGYPTVRIVEEYSAFVKQAGSDVIIGVGGGKALDTAKAVGNKTGKTIIAVPTIAATCAAWAALSILYSEEGEFAEVRRLEYSPEIILADPDILANAPIRYLNAGIADTIVKWYETFPNLKKGGRHLDLRLKIKIAEFTLDTLKEAVSGTKNQVDAYKAKGVYDDIVDAVIFLAGFVGSIRGDEPYDGFAHPFYNSITKIPETRDKLHGEKVIFGLLVQLVLEQKTEEEIVDVARLLKALNLPITLSDLGIKIDLEEKVGIVANDVVKNLQYYQAHDHTLTALEVTEAIFKADEIGRRNFQQQEIA